MAGINLNKFCAEAWDRESISQPFRTGEYVFATDGRICLRFNANVYSLIGPRDGTPTAESLEKLDWRHNEVQSWGSVETLFPLCKSCNGVGKHKCSCGHKHNCPKCSGNGRIGIKGDFKIGAAKIAERYLRLIASLPEAAIEAAPQKLDKPVAFKFKDGIGLIMGLK